MSAARRHRGYTLLELALVVVILGIVAAAAVPAIKPSSPFKLELAAEETASAIRFARSESLRTGFAHGVHVDAAENRIRVFRANLAVDPPQAIYDVYHPVSKMLYDVDVDELTMTAGVEVASYTVAFRGLCNRTDFVMFDGAGTPTCLDPASTILQQGVVTLAHGQASQDVVLHGYVGRVTSP